MSRLLMLLPVILVLAAAELYFRHFSPVGGMIYRLDEGAIFDLKPDSFKAYRHPPEDGSRKVLIRIGKEGRRGPRMNFGAGARRVVVYGDSFAAAEYSPDEETFAHRLEVALNSARSPTELPYEVINSGVTGYGPDQASAKMERELPLLKPDLVVLILFSGNDHGDLVRNKLFRLGSDGKLARQAYTLSEGIRAEFAEGEGQSRFQLARLVSRAIARFAGRKVAPAEAGGKSYASGIVKARLDEYAEYARGDREIKNLFADDYDLEMSVQADPSETAAKSALMDSVIARIAGQAREAHARFLGIVVPDPVNACASYPIQVDPREFPKYSRTLLQESALSSFARAQVPVVDLFAAFSGADCREVYFRSPNNGHWNALGQERAAELASQAIRGISTVSRP